MHNINEQQHEQLPSMQPSSGKRKYSKPDEQVNAKARDASKEWVK
jgi:hypothetical protein